jgi:hypothetical protein
MLAKKCKNQTFFTAVNFVGILAVIAVFFAQKNRPLEPIVIYNASAGKIYNATSSLVRFENKKNLLQ